MSRTDVAIIGAGPVGLAAAAHVLERGMRPLILEQGPGVGHAVRHWGHVPMFSTWSLNTDAAAVRLLDAAGWTRPDQAACPTGDGLVRDYLAPLGRVLDPWLRPGRRVTGLRRDGDGRTATFVLRTDGPHGRESFRADAVIDASGTWFQPASGGASGPVPGEAQNPAVSQAMPDIGGALRHRYSGRRVAVLGGGHSAMGNLIALAALPGTEIVWLFRAATTDRALGGGAADQLSARGAVGLQVAALIASGRIALQTSFRLARIDGSGPVAVTSADGRRIDVDEVIVATGFRPDLSMLRHLRVSLDPILGCPPALAPLIDPALHSCGTVRPHGAAELAHPEPGFWIAGMKSYGRAPTFLLATGHEQVRSIVAEIAGDHVAAARVELVLPETGVCNGPGLPGPAIAASAATAGCCGGPAVASPDACCRRDELAIASGSTGCGCAPAMDDGVPASSSACC